MVFNATFKQYLSYYVVVSFIGGGNQSTRENHQPVASHWQGLKSIQTKNILYILSIIFLTPVMGL
jgi:hypothetical protein